MRRTTVEDVEHPGWCDLAHCTATVPKPGYRAGETGYHRSAPITLEHVPHVADMVFDPELNPLIAHLTRACPPWDPATFLNLGTLAEPQLLSLPTTHAREVLHQLGGLLALAAADGPT
jgi:hypothetical protein